MSKAAMIPVGCMAKRVTRSPAWLDASHLTDLYSVSSCIAKNFADYIPYCRHNGYWYFDSPEIILDLAREHSLDLSESRLFFYEMYGQEFHDEDSRWGPFMPVRSLPTAVEIPPDRTLEGFDVVTFSCGTSPECSPLSCNGLAGEIDTNPHCLLPSLERARQCLESGRFRHTEPGPFRIVAVHSTNWPGFPR